MMKLLKKKTIKTIPLWVIIASIMSVGTAFGALVWISNSQSQTLEVLPWEIELESPTGDFTGIRVDSLAVTEWPYTVNVPEQSTGYIQVSFFITPGVTPSLSDVEIPVLNVYIGTSSTPIALQPGYPVVDGQNIVYYYGNANGTPYDFGSTTGTIEIFWIGRSPDLIQMSVRLTSGLPSA